ncbi:50S ribosomal protein L25 [Nevskia soli]|uniref:50S ribosomal protein L25 n=1 Tax=Nevskia soli TaxID=418856 RepID=UPI0015D8B36D|nr:50S ribosomal protein L25 [Nevskia soli]
MRTDTVVAASIREGRGKNEAHRTRAAGHIPAVVYGAFKDPVSIAVSPKEILGIIHSKTGHNTIFDLDIAGGDKSPVMVVDEQYDPVKGRLLHVDLKRIDLTRRLRVTVPVVTQGEPKGVKQQGGLLEVITRQVEIECVPDSIPENFVIDVSELMLNESKRASDIKLAEGVRLLSAPESVIAHVVGLKAEEEPAVAADVAAPTSEPEVVKKGKKEDEAPAAETGKKK